MMAWQAFQPRHIEEKQFSSLLTWVIGGLTFRLISPQTRWPGFVLGIVVMGSGWSLWAIYLPVIRTLTAIKEQSQLCDKDKADLEREMARWRGLNGADVLDERVFLRLKRLARNTFFTHCREGP